MDRLPKTPPFQAIAQARRAYTLAKTPNVISVSTLGEPHHLVTGRTLVESREEAPWMYRRDIIIKDALKTTAHQADHVACQQATLGVTVLQRMSKVSSQEAENQITSMEEGVKLYTKFEEQCLPYLSTGKADDSTKEGYTSFLDVGLNRKPSDNSLITLSPTTLQRDNDLARKSAFAFLRWLKQYTDEHVRPLLKHLDPVFADGIRKREDCCIPWLRERVDLQAREFLSPFFTHADGCLDACFAFSERDDDVIILLNLRASRALHLPSFEVDVELQAGDIVFVKKSLAFEADERLYWSTERGSRQMTVVCSYPKVFLELAKNAAQKRPPAADASGRDEEAVRGTDEATSSTSTPNLGTASNKRLKIEGHDNPRQ